VVAQWISRTRPCAGGVVGGETELTGKAETHRAKKPRRHTPSDDPAREDDARGSSASRTRHRAPRPGTATRRLPRCCRGRPALQQDTPPRAAPWDSHKAAAQLLPRQAST